MFDVLVVCERNLCRSPAAVALLNRRLVHLQHRIQISSRGVSVVEGVRPCSKLWLDEYPPEDATSLIAHHRPIQLTERDVAHADLVLTAGLAQRAAVARLLPTARSRTFTLREAAELSRLVMGSQRAELRDDRTGQQGLGPRWWVAEMNAARGDTSPPAVIVVRSWRRPRRPATFSSWDVPDPHQDNLLSHARSRHVLTDAVDALADSLHRTVHETQARR